VGFYDSSVGAGDFECYDRSAAEEGYGPGGGFGHLQMNFSQRTTSNQSRFLPFTDNINNSIDRLFNTPKVQMMSRFLFIIQLNQEILGNLEGGIDIPYACDGGVVPFDADVVCRWLVGSMDYGISVGGFGR